MPVNSIKENKEQQAITHKVIKGILIFFLFVICAPVAVVWGSVIWYTKYLGGIIKGLFK